ncbi:transporter [candidate division KSB1 bacterium]|nr:transporter [candidate division KSB1 bacterium]
MSKLFANLALLLSILFGIVGQLLLKKATLSKRIGFDATHLTQSIMSLVLNPYLLSWIFLAGISAALWIFVVSKLELSFAYPVSMTLSYMLILVLSWWLFNENMSITRWLGVALMCVGLFLAYRS